MKGRTTLYLFLSMIILGTFIYFQNSWRAKQYRQEFERVQLFGLNTDSLLSIQFQGTNGVVVNCVNDNGVWMTSGTGDESLGRADVALLYRVISNLNKLGKGTTITAEELQVRGFNASEYGFDEPQAKIVAKDHAGTHTWVVGRKTPLENMIYVRYEGDDNIYTSHSGLLTLIPSEEDQFRDRMIFVGALPGIRRLEVVSTDGLVEIVKDPEMGWQIRQPMVSRADQVKVSSYIEQLYQLKAESFIADDVVGFAVYGLQNNGRQISLGGSDGTARTLMIGDAIPNKPGFVYARRADDTTVFAMKDSVTQLMNLNLDVFRDRQLMPLPLEKIQRITITHGSDTMVLQKNDKGGWMIDEPRWVAEERVVKALLSHWGDAVIGQFDDDAHDDDNLFTHEISLQPEWTFEFATADGARCTLKVLPHDPAYEAIVVRRNEEPASLLANPKPIPERMINPLVYKRRQMLAIDANKITKVSFQRQDEEAQVADRKGEAFVLSGVENGARLNRSRLEEMIQLLTNLKVVEYVEYNPESLTVYGLDSPQVSIQLSLNDTNQLGQVLLLGMEGSQGRYAMVKGRDVVFVLDKESETAFLSGFVDRE
jgi:hypothetical protein